MERAGVLGFMLVLLIFFIGLSNDIERFSNGEGFDVRRSSHFGAIGSAWNHRFSSEERRS